MGHASELSHKLVSAQETVKGVVRHQASSLPGPVSRAKRKEEQTYPVVFACLAPAAACDLSREHFALGGAADGKLYDQRLCSYRQDSRRPYRRPAGGHHG